MCKNKIVINVQNVIKFVKFCEFKKNFLIDGHKSE